MTQIPFGHLPLVGSWSNFKANLADLWQRSGNWGTVRNETTWQLLKLASVTRV